MSEMRDFNQSVVEEFRANQGVVGGPFTGAPLLLLTTTGARTGQKRVNPLVALVEAVAVPVTGAERDRLFAAQVEKQPGFADYEKATDRVIPVVELRRRA